MQLHDLTPAPGSTKNRKRVGRGNSSGHGTTLAAARRARVPALAAPRVPASRVARLRWLCACPSFRASATPVVSSTPLLTLSVSSVSSRMAL